MRWIFLFAVILCSAWGNNTLRAQEALPGEPSTEAGLPGASLSAAPWQKQLDQLTVRLSLTPEQIPAAEQLLAAYYTELIDNPPATPELKRARKRTFRNRFRQLLTPEQQADLRSGTKSRKATATAQKQRHWLDVLIDDVATPLLEKRKKNRRKGG